MDFNNGQGFDTSTYQNNYDLIPTGWYTAQISKEEERTSSTGTPYLSYEFTIIEGQFANRKVFVNFNLYSSNPEAARISRENIVAIGHALGMINVRNSSELVGGVLQIRITTRNQEGYEPRNDVKGYKPCANTQTMAMPSQPQTMAMPTQSMPSQPVQTQPAQPQPVQQPPFGGVVQPQQQGFAQMNPAPSNAPWLNR